MKFLLLLGLTTASFCIHAGSSYNTVPETVFTDLKHNEPALDGVIVDEQDTISVNNVNIAGKTVFKKMLQESNDATNQLDFSGINKIEVIDPFFQSKRHYKPGSDQLPFTKIKLTFLNGSNDEFLLPQGVIISGISRDTKVKKAWQLNKIKSISINHTTTPETQKGILTPDISEAHFPKISNSSEMNKPQNPDVKTPTTTPAPSNTSTSETTQNSEPAPAVTLPDSTVATLFGDFGSKTLLKVYEQTINLIERAHNLFKQSDC